MLFGCANGFGGLALAALAARGTDAAPHTDGANRKPGPLDPRAAHFPPRAKNVIFLYMDGGPSQVDTFDYKPMLEKYHGRSPQEVIGRLEPTQFDDVGVVLKSPWKFQQRGESGLWVSDLFPCVSQWVDELAVVRSMVSHFSEHTNANYFLHTGSGLQGRPSMGAWVGYGLGSENQNLPGFVVLNGGLIPPGGLDNFNSGFLPAAYQGSLFKPGPQPVANIVPHEPDRKLQESKLALIHQLDRARSEQLGQADPIESAIANYELAARMQLAIPELLDTSGESPAMCRQYGLDASFENTRIFGRQCLIARRLVERGVRFVELTCPSGNGDRWDQHSNLVDGHAKNALSVDQPIAALIGDLKSRGLLDETLVVWGGEFGRTPFAQGANGRDHNPTAFSIWLCGGGVQGGSVYGTTDEWGYRVAQDRVEIHDLHATILHLLGIDHERLTFRFSGRDMRLTDVHGKVLHSILKKRGRSSFLGLGSSPGT
jgi:hypothetical protein